MSSPNLHTIPFAQSSPHPPKRIATPPTPFRPTLPFAQSSPPPSRAPCLGNINSSNSTTRSVSPTPTTLQRRASLPPSKSSSRFIAPSSSSSTVLSPSRASSNTMIVSSRPNPSASLRSKDGLKPKTPATPQGPSSNSTTSSSMRQKPSSDRSAGTLGTTGPSPSSRASSEKVGYTPVRRPSVSSLSSARSGTAAASASDSRQSVGFGSSTTTNANARSGLSRANTIGHRPTNTMPFRRASSSRSDSSSPTFPRRSSTSNAERTTNARPPTSSSSSAAAPTAMAAQQQQQQQAGNSSSSSSLRRSSVQSHRMVSSSGSVDSGRTPPPPPAPPRPTPTPIAIPNSVGKQSTLTPSPHRVVHQSPSHLTPTPPISSSSPPNAGGGSGFGRTGKGKRRSSDGHSISPGARSCSTSLPALEEDIQHETEVDDNDDDDDDDGDSLVSPAVSSSSEDIGLVSDKGSMIEKNLKRSSSEARNASDFGELWWEPDGEFRRHSLEAPTHNGPMTTTALRRQTEARKRNEAANPTPAPPPRTFSLFSWKNSSSPTVVVPSSSFSSDWHPSHRNGGGGSGSSGTSGGSGSGSGGSGVFFSSVRRGFFGPSSSSSSYSPSDPFSPASSSLHRPYPKKKNTAPIINTEELSDPVAYKRRATSVDINVESIIGPSANAMCQQSREPGSDPVIMPRPSSRMSAHSHTSFGATTTRHDNNNHQTNISRPNTPATGVEPSSSSQTPGPYLTNPYALQQQQRQRSLSINSDRTFTRGSPSRSRPNNRMSSGSGSLERRQSYSNSPSSSREDRSAPSFKMLGFSLGGGMTSPGKKNNGGGQRFRGISGGGSGSGSLKHAISEPNVKAQFNRWMESLSSPFATLKSTPNSTPHRRHRSSGSSVVIRRTVTARAPPPSSWSSGSKSSVAKRGGGGGKKGSRSSSSLSRIIIAVEPASLKVDPAPALVNPQISKDVIVVKEEDLFDYEGGPSELYAVRPGAERNLLKAIKADDKKKMLEERRRRRAELGCVDPEHPEWEVWNSMLVD